jgi:hypothetical protein
MLDSSDPAKAGERGDRRIDEAEAEIVRRIFQEFADGHSPGRLLRG